MRFEPKKNNDVLNFSAFESHVSPQLGQSSRVADNRDFSAFQSQAQKEKSVKSVKKEEHSIGDFASVHSDHQEDMESSMRIEPKPELNFSGF